MNLSLAETSEEESKLCFEGQNVNIFSRDLYYKDFYNHNLKLYFTIVTKLRLVTIDYPGVCTVKLCTAVATITTIWDTI
jgi:hypothetical protein